MAVSKSYLTLKYQKMTDPKITLEPYSTRWKEKFLIEKSRLNDILIDYLVGSIEHVGSTAVEGLIAKPTIDIMVGVSSLKDSFNAIKLLTNSGYCYYPYKPEQMHWFCAPSPEKRDFHLHLIPFESKLWQERIAFRNALQQSISLRQQYAELKLSLMQEDDSDRDKYSRAKTPFIKKVLANSQSTSNK